MTIFRDYAEHYWNAGLPVIPLMPKDKLPCIKGWQKYQSEMPSFEERESWLQNFANGNIGLPLGPQSGLIALDIDTDDPKIIGVIEQCFPPSPWTRVGQKGKVMIFKYEGQPTFRIRTKEGKSICEMLGPGTQIVLPPSIHPKTGAPYYANKDLVECLGEVRKLPPNIAEILRDALRQVGVEANTPGVGAITEFVSSGNRDNRLVSMAGLFSNDILRGHITLLEALERIRAWAENFTEKVYGDPVDPEKGAKKVVEFLVRDVTGPKGRVLPKGWDEGLTDEQKAKLGLSIFTEDHEKWSYQQILDHFNAQRERVGVEGSDEQFLSLVKATAAKIAVNRELDNVEEDQLIRYIAQISGGRISVAALRRDISAMRQGAIAGQDHKEIAEAVVKDLEEVGGEIRTTRDGTMWQWRGSHWDKMDEADVLKYIASEYGSYQAARRANDHMGVFRTIKNLTNSASLAKLNVRGINFVNGFLTEDLELKPHHPDFGMTYCLPYAYEPEKAGKCSKWLQMLSDYWGEDPDYAEKVELLREAMALTLFNRATDFQRVFCLYGVAGSGKSCILNIVTSLMPASAVCAIPPSEWGDRFAPAEMQHKLLNVAGELSEHRHIDAERFKMISTGEQIMAQHKNQPIFHFSPRCAHWFASNHLPKTKDSSDGFTRRWSFLHFPRRLPVSLRTENYDQVVVSEEREAIAAWAVQGILSLRANRNLLTDPASSIELREQLENQLNSVRSFIADLREAGRLRLGVQEHASLSEEMQYSTFDTLWTEYRSYCLLNGVVPVGSKTLATRLVDLAGIFGFQTVKRQNSAGLLVTQYRYITLAAARKVT